MHLQINCSNSGDYIYLVYKDDYSELIEYESHAR